MDKLLKRLKEFQNNNNVPPRNGLFFDIAKNRLYLMEFELPIAHIDIEILRAIENMGDYAKKKTILDQPEPLRTMLADVFYSGWEFNQYLRTGIRTRAY